ncbi:kinase-regulated stress-responsive transcription factor skn7 [Massospora cicadina]|nr:kinase-regulated stress-responsive transcription factor skn7 [Massospora cicadina]
MDDALSPTNSANAGPTDFIQKLFRYFFPSSCLFGRRQISDLYGLLHSLCDLEPHKVMLFALIPCFSLIDLRNFRMINDPHSSSLAQWSEAGDTFIILDPHDFAKMLLPRHFKHNNFQSFIRQLNNAKQHLLDGCLPAISKRLERMMSEVSNLHKVMMAQDELMQTIVQCIVSQEKALMLSVDPQVRREYAPPVIDQSTNTVHQPQFSSNIQRLVQTYKQVSKASGEILNNFAQAAQDLYPCMTSTSESQVQGQVVANFSMPNTFNQIAAATAPPVVQEMTPQEPFPYQANKGYQKDAMPAKKRPKVKGESAALPWTWIVPPNVLLVDDDPTCQAIYARSLQILGCSYEIAADGVEAVKKMQSRKYDMVLMDIWMPEMDGLSATKRIREFDRGTPIIAITGDYRESDREFYLKQGINEVLGKPLRVGELGPIMQKHWLKFCISRDADPPQDPAQAQVQAQDFSQLHYSSQLPPQNNLQPIQTFFPPSASHL